MIDYLRTIFGEDIKQESFQYPVGTPNYIRNGYKAWCFSWDGQKCVVLKPVSASWRLPGVKRQFRNFMRMSDLPCFLCFDRLTSAQRKNLIKEKIPFVVAGSQLYMPFWGVHFTEKEKAVIHLNEWMAPGTQLAVLFLYYKNIDKINLTELSRQLNISKATSTRIAGDLKQRGLILMEYEGTNKWIRPSCPKKEFLLKSYECMRSPVIRDIYVKKNPEGLTLPLCGIRALFMISMVAASKGDPGVAISRNRIKRLPKKDIISEEEFLDFGGSVIEEWSYDCTPVMEGGRVDDISLLLSLACEKDERIQQGLDEIRRKHGLPVAEEE